MNATELAKILGGWPTEARPRISVVRLDAGRPGDEPRVCFRSINVIDDAHAIDLATVSGLRWLLKRDGYIGLWDGGWNHIDSAGLEYDFDSEGFAKTRHSSATLLHAINSAILATKGKQ